MPGTKPVMTEGEDADGDGGAVDFEDLLSSIEGEDLAERDEQDEPDGEPTGEDPTTLMEGLESRSEENTETSFDDLLDQIQTKTRTTDETPAANSIRGMRGIDAQDAVLVIGSLDSSTHHETCVDDLTDETCGRPHILLIDLHPRGGSALAELYESVGPDKAELAYVHHKRIKDLPDDIRTVPVSDPEDLTHLGIAISKILSDWNETDHPVKVCFRSLTALLQHANDQRIFRFMHLFLGRVDDADARVHVHIDGESHSDQTIILFKPLFDATVEVTPDGLERH